MADELIDIVDENNNPLGIKKMKSEAWRKGLWHRASHIWIYNSKGEILLQLRSKSKLHSPNKWGASVGGHIGAGDEPLPTALREAKEEIGLDIEARNLEFIKVIKSADDMEKELLDNEFLYVYLLKFDDGIAKLKLQNEEVEEVRFFSLGELERELRFNPEKYAQEQDYLFWVINEVRGRLIIKS